MYRHMAEEAALVPLRESEITAQLMFPRCHNTCSPIQRTARSRTGIIEIGGFFQSRLQPIYVRKVTALFA